MVTKKKSDEKKGYVKVGKLKLDKETVKNLTDSQQKQIKGGACTLTSRVNNPIPTRDYLQTCWSCDQTCKCVGLE